jgi:hypothetical protein
MNQLGMPELQLANKLRQISHMEILQEGTRPEPRLRRLLGHINTYDNVERWRLEYEQQIIASEMIHDKESQTMRMTKPICQSSVASSQPALKLRTLSEFQAAVRNHFIVEKETTVNTEEVSSDSDSEDETESEASSDDDWDEEEELEGTLDDDSDDESAWSDGEDPIIAMIREGTKSLLQRYQKDDIVYFSELSPSMLQAMDTEKQ